MTAGGENLIFVARVPTQEYKGWEYLVFPARVPTQEHKGLEYLVFVARVPSKGPQQKLCSEYELINIKM